MKYWDAFYIFSTTHTILLTNQFHPESRLIVFFLILFVCFFLKMIQYFYLENSNIFNHIDLWNRLLWLISRNKFIWINSFQTMDVKLWKLINITRNDGINAIFKEVPEVTIKGITKIYQRNCRKKIQINFRGRNSQTKYRMNSQRNWRKHFKRNLKILKKFKNAKKKTNKIWWNLRSNSIRSNWSLNLFQNAFLKQFRKAEQNNC